MMHKSVSKKLGQLLDKGKKQTKEKRNKNKNKKQKAKIKVKQLKTIYA